MGKFKQRADRLHFARPAYTAVLSDNFAVYAGLGTTGPEIAITAESRKIDCYLLWGSVQ